MKTLLILPAVLLLMMIFAPMAPAADLYVATNACGTGDGSSWANATSNLQGAIDAIDGTYRTNTVWVSNGVYEVGGVTNYPTDMLLTNRVAIWKAITVRSANNDPTNTIIKGAWDTATNGPAAVRCVYMTNGASLIGFTLTNGATLNTAVDGERMGGGICCPAINTVTISNCIIAGNSANYNGGGAYYGALFNCTISGNSVANSGGGTYLSILSNCTISGNSAGSQGGGIRESTAYNCTISGNSAGAGGGSSWGYLYYCILSNNSVTAIGGNEGVGGAKSSGGAYNCLIVGNSAVYSGGANDCTLCSCTVVGNKASGYAGGTLGGTIYNSIVYYNDAPSYSNWRSATVIINSCTTPTNGFGEAGNTTNDPMFITNGIGYGTNHVAGNYRLSANSPCVNTGSNNVNWLLSYDLDGRTRIRYGVVDIGAYEAIYEGAIYHFR